MKDISQEFEKLLNSPIPTPAVAIASAYSEDELSKLLAIASERTKSTNPHYLRMRDLGSRLLEASLPHTRKQAITGTVIIGAGGATGLALYATGVPLGMAALPALAIVPVVMCGNAIINDPPACYEAGQRVGKFLSYLYPRNWFRRAEKPAFISSE